MENENHHIQIDENMNENSKIENLTEIEKLCIQIEKYMNENGKIENLSCNPTLK
jgi:hypothetical protein